MDSQIPDHIDVVLEQSEVHAYSVVVIEGAERALIT